MNTKPYLLTYSKGGNLGFRWFDNAEDMDIFIKEESVNVFDKIYMKNVEILN